MMFKPATNSPLIIATDGACRNYKTGVGAAYVREQVSDRCAIHYGVEVGSTSQRGELLGMIKGLEIAKSVRNEAFIVTDSEYVFFMLYNEWYVNWSRYGWTTIEGLPLKNQDLIKKMVALYEEIKEKVILYHIKGHIIPFGSVAGLKLLSADPTGFKLFNASFDKFHKEKEKRAAKIDKSIELFKKNNGYVPPMNSFVQLLVSNMVADIASGLYADSYERPKKEF